MKKGIILMLILSLILTSAFPQAIFAKTDITNEKEIKKKEQSDILLSELNEIAVQKNRLASVELENKISLNSNISNIRIQLDVREQEINASLNKLGIRILNPNNSNDMAILAELFNASSDSTGTMPFSSPPDLATFATMYSLYYNDGSYKVADGTIYPYRYIKVIDNKGYNKLMAKSLYNIADKSTAPQLIEAFIEYNMTFALSQYLGNIQNGWIIDWTIGSLFTILQNLSTDVVISGAGPNALQVTLSSLTSMEYTYVYNKNSWRLIGTSSAVDYLKQTQYSLNINGKLHGEQAQESWKSTSGLLWFGYIIQYHAQQASFPNYHRIDELGSFGVVTPNKTYTFMPRFAPLPAHLANPLGTVL